MSLPVLLAIAWALAATLVAFLPMRVQILPGALLLAAAPVLIGLLGWHHGWLAGLAALAAVLSMFRKPLRHLWQVWRGTAPGGPDPERTR